MPRSPKMRLVLNIRVGDRNNPTQKEVHGLGRPSTIDMAREGARRKIKEAEGGCRDVYVMGAIIEEQTGSNWTPVGNVT